VLCRSLVLCRSFRCGQPWLLGWCCQRGVNRLFQKLWFDSCRGFRCRELVEGAREEVVPFGFRGSCDLGRGIDRRVKSVRRLN